MRIVTATFALLFLTCTFSYSQIAKEQLDQKDLSNLSVMLFQPPKDSSGSPSIGTATIVTHSGKFYILTASHVANSMRTDALVVFRIDGDIPVSISLTEMTQSKIPIWTHHNIADIAIIEINSKDPNLAKRLTNFSLSSDRILSTKEIPDRDMNVFFLGFPMLDMKLEHFSPLTFWCYPSSGLITQKRADTKQKCNFFYLDVPSIQGCSGSGVYVGVSRNGVRFGPNKTYLIGIMHGTFGDNTGGKMAMVTHSYYLWDLLD